MLVAATFSPKEDNCLLSFSLSQFTSTFILDVLMPICSVCTPEPDVTIQVSAWYVGVEGATAVVTGIPSWFTVVSVVVVIVSACWLVPKSPTVASLARLEELTNNTSSNNEYIQPPDSILLKLKFVTSGL